MRLGHASLLRPWLGNDKIQTQIGYCEGLSRVLIMRIEENEKSSMYRTYVSAWQMGHREPYTTRGLDEAPIVRSRSDEDIKLSPFAYAR